MKKGLLFVVLMVLLVSSCGGEKVLVFTPTEIPPPPIPGPRNIPALAQNTETPLPAKIGMVFLVDRSKSLNGCNKTQARFGIPNFFISLFFIYCFWFEIS